jgi:hypothetical protein
MIGVLGFDSRRGMGIFHFTTVSRMVLGPTQPSIQWVPGALSLEVKWPRREADHSPPSSAEVKNAWSYTSTPQNVFMAWCLVKHRDNFTFLPLPLHCVYCRNHAALVQRRYKNQETTPGMFKKAAGVVSLTVLGISLGI